MKEIVELLRRVVDDADNVSIRNDYSGRGMYGKSCVGITGSKAYCMTVIGETIKLAYSLSAVQEDDVDGDSVVDVLMNFEQDSMGYDVIIYWPHMQAEDEDFTVPKTIKAFAELCEQLDHDAIYQLFEDVISQELRDEIIEYTHSTTNEPVRDALVKIGEDYGIQSLINY